MCVVCVCVCGGGGCVYVCGVCEEYCYNIYIFEVSVDILVKRGVLPCRRDTALQR